MKNVLYYSDIDYATFGGNFMESMKDLQSTMKKKGCSTYFIFPEDAKKSNWINDFEHVYFTKLTYKGFKNLFDELLEKYDIGVVHVHFVTDFRDALKIKLALSKRAKLIFHFRNHLNYKEGFVGFAKRICDTVAFRNTIGIGVSEDVAEGVRKAIKSDTIYTVYNGLYFDRLNTINKQEYMKKWKEGDRYYNLLIHGNHAQRKGIDFAFNAINKLRDSGYDIRLFVTASDKEKCRNVMEDIIGGKLYDYVSIIPTRNDLASYFEETDIFLSPSREEGLTCSVSESVYCGCPAVATRCCGQEELRTIFKLPNTYWVSDPKGKTTEEIADELVVQIKKAINELGSTDKEKDREYIVNALDHNRWVNEILEFYE